MQVEILCEPGADLNEDTFFLHADDISLTAAAIDGATSVMTAQILAPLLGELTGAAYAARHVRDRFGLTVRLPLYEMLTEANSSLRENILAYYGRFESIVWREDALSAYVDDPRYGRAALPACVLTLVRIKQRQLFYVHLGDTSLLLFHNDGTVTVAVGGEGRSSRDEMYTRLKALQSERGLASPSGLLNEGDIQQQMIARRVYHNYRDVTGTPGGGVGVVNGLPEMTDYAEGGQIMLEDVAAVLVCTDGFLWPAEADESEAQVTQRLHKMRALIETDGLRGYYDRLRAAEIADFACDRYPRLKPHDDATALLIRIP